MRCVRNCLAFFAVEAVVLLALVRRRGQSSAAGHSDLSSRFSTIPAFRGDCSTVWTTGYLKYSLPYPVHFSPYGTFTWMAPFLNRFGAEIGEGSILSTPVTEFQNGTWTARYFAATRFYPGGTTTCCCEFLSWTSEDAPRILTDYCRATLPGTGGTPLAEVCEPYSQEPCPHDNATAYEQMGSPFVEQYGSCKEPTSLLFVPALGVLLAVNVVVLLFFALTPGQKELAPIRLTEIALSYGLTWLQRHLKGEAEAGDHFTALAEEGRGGGSGVISR